MRRMLLLIALASTVSCNQQNSAGWKLHIPSVAEMRALVPADLIPSLPPVDPSKDGQLEFEQAERSFPKSWPDLREYPDLASVRKKRAQLSKELGPWNASLDSVVAASRAQDWSRLRSHPLKPQPLVPADYPVPVEFPYFAALKNSIKLVLLRAELRLDKYPQQAAEDYLAAIRIGRHLQQGRQTLVGFLVGNAIVGMYNDAIVKDLPAMSATTTRRLMAEPPDLMNLPKSFAETLRVDLGDEVLMFHYSLVETEKVLEKGRCPIIAALKDHPKPFDLNDSMECLVTLARTDIASLTNPPPSTKPSELAETFHPGLDNLPDIGEESGWPEPQKLKALLRAVPNPLGRMLLSGMMEFDDLSGVTTLPQASTSAVSLLLASHLYSLQYGMLPSTLDELVRAQMLRVVPTDPYGTGAFHYDAKRKVIWSNGPDRKDDGGHDKPFKFKDARDMVWSLDGHKEAR
jgi:hypothetical protein